MEENKKVKNGSKSAYVIICILMIMVLALGGFIIYDKFIKDDSSKCRDDKQVVDNNKSDVEEKQETSKSEEEPNNTEKEEVEDYKSIIFNRFDIFKIANETLYKNNSFSKRGMTSKVLIDRVLNDLSNNFKYYYDVYDEDNDKLDLDSVPTITYDELTKTISKYLLNVSINESSIRTLSRAEADEYYSDIGYNRIIYIVDGGIKVFTIDGGDTVSLLDYDVLYRNFVKAEKENDKLYIYVKQAFARYDENSETGVSYYKNYSDSNYTETNKKYVFIQSAKGVVDVQNLTDSYKKEYDEINLNWDLYNTYKYTFKISNNNYYFESLELVK